MMIKQLASPKKYVRLDGSEPQQPAGGVRNRQGLDPGEIIRATVVVRPRSSIEERRDAIRRLISQLPHRRYHLGPGQFANLHGAHPEDLSRVASFAQDCGLKVTGVDGPRRCVVLNGTATAFNRAFKVQLTTYDHGRQSYRSHDGALRIPKHLDGIVDAVLGLDNRSLMSHHLYIAGHYAVRHTSPRKVIQAYDFPGGNGEGQCIAIIELGGGFYGDDIKAYFDEHGLAVPKISVVEIGGQKNNPAPRPLIREVLEAMGLSPAENRWPHAGKRHPSRASGNPKSAGASGLSAAEIAHAFWTVETTLDIQLIGSFANAAHIVVYFAPNTAEGKYHALTTALTSRKRQPTVISCSWGAPEDSLPRALVHSLDRVFQDAALKGVTVCFSSGDHGDGSSSRPHGRPVVQFPASSPHALACGGTHWVGPKNEITEVVWNELRKQVYRIQSGSGKQVYRFQSGGGVSEVFDQPEWQYSAGVELKTGRKGRGVPDVAGKADVETGYSMLVGQYAVTMGGTSAVAPMWAGLVARLNQDLGQSVGYLTPFLYQDLCRNALHGPTKGSNGKYFRAGVGWDACTGLGTPNGKKLLAALKTKL